MRLLVTGTKGQVARALIERAEFFPKINVSAVGRPQMDLENTATIFSAIENARPDFIVNAAAYTGVDNAELEPDRANTINQEGAASVAKAAKFLRVPLIHISTNYVFSGSKTTPYIEDDEAAPLGVYGKSKLAGELAVRTSYPEALILRTSWIYSPFGSNFVKKILNLADERQQLRVVDDQIGNPTNALDLADAILRIAPFVKERDGMGLTFHVVSKGSTNWYELAKNVFEVSKSSSGPWAEVSPISTSQYPSLAARPPNSELNAAAFVAQFGFELPHWTQSVEKTVRKLTLAKDHFATY